MKFVKGVAVDVNNLMKPFSWLESGEREFCPSVVLLSAKDLHFECSLEVTMHVTFLCKKMIPFLLGS